MVLTKEKVYQIAVSKETHSRLFSLKNHAQVLSANKIYYNDVLIHLLDENEKVMSIGPDTLAEAAPEMYQLEEKS